MREYACVLSFSLGNSIIMTAPVVLTGPPGPESRCIRTHTLRSGSRSLFSEPGIQINVMVETDLLAHCKATCARG